MSEENILPDGPRTRNTRDPTPLRRRNSKQPLRDTHRNKNYSDNIDYQHLDSPKKKKHKSNIAGKLRQPSQSRIMAQKILTRSQLTQGALPGVTRKLIGTYIKEEDKKPKVEKRESDFYQEELISLQTETNRKKSKHWPESAKFVHIDGTACSETCMTTSKYHQDPSDQTVYTATTPTATPFHDPRNTRSMGVSASTVSDMIKSGTQESMDKPSQTLNSEELEVATTVTHGESVSNYPDKNVNEHEGELRCATLNSNLPVDTGIKDYSNQQLNDQGELHHETSDSNLFDDMDTNITGNKIKYNVNRALNKCTNTINVDLPDIEMNSHPPDLELPGATPSTNNHT